MNPPPDSALADPHQLIADLQRELAESTRERDRLQRDLADAHDQQTATAELLGVINSSPGDLVPVFDAMLEKALRLCDAAFGALHTFDGDAVHTVALRNVPPPFAEFLTRGPLRLDPKQSLLGKCIYERRTVHVEDRADASYRGGAPLAVAAVELGEIRTVLHVPLTSDDTALGAFTIYRREVRPFSDKQIALLQNFAAQAVIAMENARLITETREALEQQTATAEVLGVINASPGDLTPVFDAMLEKAMRLCEAEIGTLWTYDGEWMHASASRGAPPAFAEFLQQKPTHPLAGLPRRLLGGERFVQTDDLAATEGYRSGDPLIRAVVDLGGVRTLLTVPLRKDETVLGNFGIYRQEVRPFSEKQNTLLENFAAQAVIAMENARLITETREALEQQTATAEVLQVINSSPGDLAPVFEAMLDKAVGLCEAHIGILFTHENGSFTAAAWHGTPERFQEFLTREPLRPSPDTGLGRMVLERRLIHLTDVIERDSYRRGDPLSVASVELGNIRTFAAAPLVKDDKLVGAFVVYRREVRPFADKQIALLENFAQQAVIAMENARLITETREALEQQTATAEVLGVINSSPGELTPVFDAMLEKATALCDAPLGTLWLFDGEHINPVATRGASPELSEFLAGPRPPNPVQQRQLQGEGPIHMADLKATALYRDGDTLARAVADLGGIQTVLSVPLRREDRVLGLFGVYRQEIRPFSDKQIALIENFAAQAVIAMENARLITETRERTADLQESLEHQTATSDVLGVISRSGGELGVVFQTLVATAARICEADTAAVMRLQEGRFRLAAAFGVSDEWKDFVHHHPIAPERGTVTGRVALEGRVVHVEDVKADPEYAVPEAQQIGGFRTALGVPLMHEGHPIGVIALGRFRVEPFTDKQIELVRTFADQAVIAMENARLITETREALEQQTATAEVLGVINASPGDLGPVFDAMLDKAMRLCGAAFGELQTYNGEHFEMAAIHGLPPRYAEFRMSRTHVYGSGTIPARLLAGERLIQVLDITDEDAYRDGEPNRLALADLGGARTVLAVPLVKDDALLGFIVVYRQEVRSFSDKQIALLENFAQQAVIAMENARLITETREALEQQTATAEVLQVINSSPGDLAPVFDAMLEKALSLCQAVFGALWTYDGSYLHLAACRGDLPIPEELIGTGIPTDAKSHDASGRLLRGEPIIHITDILEDHPDASANQLRRILIDAGGRTLLAVPLWKDRVFLGYFAIYRREVRPFSDKQIALLQNFAAQAVIAMENARLITETREALEQQTATAEVLGVINASPGDLAPVFDAMLDKATRLCGAAYGHLWTYDGEFLHPFVSRGEAHVAAWFQRGGPRRPKPNEPLGKVLAGAEFLQVVDALLDEGYQAVPDIYEQLKLNNIRTILLMPLRKEDVPLGMFVVYRQEVRPFTDKQIALLQNFAAQAVIAIENARLLDEVRQRQAELRVTFDNMADGVVMFDEDLRLAAWNRNFQELLDLPDAVLAERPSYADYLRILAERGEFGTEDIEAELGRRLQDTDQELRLERARPDGRVIEVRRNAVPDGGFVLIYSDITERKRSEAEIRAARDAAEAAYADLKAAQANLIQAEKMASLGQLTAGIAHEIKNPLNFVNNFASLSNELLDELKDEAEPALATLADDKRAEIDETLVMLSGNLEKIAEHGKRADNIVKSMLEHSRGVSGERREVDLNNLIEEALNLAYHGARAQNQDFNITLERDYAASLKPIGLAPQEITRVFLNLFGNGFYAANKRARANGDGSFHPVLAVATCEAEDAIEVRVRDNGTGIAPEIRDKLFQPFFTTKPTGEGTGLGLSISYDIVTQQHGGTITVESEPGLFTEFTVRLPRH